MIASFECLWIDVGAVPGQKHSPKDFKWNDGQITSMSNNRSRFFLPIKQLHQSFHKILRVLHWFAKLQSDRLSPSYCDPTLQRSPSSLSLVEICHCITFLLTRAIKVCSTDITLGSWSTSFAIGVPEVSSWSVTPVWPQRGSVLQRSDTGSYITYHPCHQPERRLHFCFSFSFFL